MQKNGPGLPSRTNSLARTTRLRGRNAILEVIKRGRTIHGKTLRLWHIPGRPTRLAISVAKGYGNAVRRNRAKRIIREFLRYNKKLWPVNRWILIKVMAGPDSLRQADFEKLMIAELKRLFEEIA